MGFSSFMLGLASAFLVCASVSFALHGLFGFYYLTAGGASASAAVVVTLLDSRRAAEVAVAASTSQ
ncbi:MAG: hypothetical protein QOJ26_1834 [Thermoplasmata archaeon]|jgi:hypothetical protein|nr:hypothetical protein [Thermoplasmata archaeon]MEA3166950.1 hypothetical protein [Thermoplasmata archaeon]